MSEQRTCRFCGASVSADARYCDRCGTPLNSEAASQRVAARTWYRRPWVWVAVVVAFALLGTASFGLYQYRVASTRAPSAPVLTAPSGEVSPPLTPTQIDSRTLAGYRQSVVSITVSGTHGNRTGSGFVMDASGHVVTAAHLVDGAQGCISVVADGGKTYSGTLLGLDDRRDIALLHVPDLRVGPLAFGESKGLRPGDDIYVLGNPVGVGNTVSLSGSINRVGDEATIDERYYANLIQLGGVSVVAGTSGGPLVLKTTGQVVGVVMAGSNAPIAWAVPSDEVTGLIKQWSEIPPGQPCSVPSSLRKISLQLATITPLSGAQSIEGTDLADGAELALRDMASSLKLVGYEVTVKRFDDGGSAATGRDQADKAVYDPKVVAAVGSHDSAVTSAVAERLRGEGMPIVAPTASGDDLTAHGWKHFNRIVAASHRQEHAIARYAKETLGVSSVYILDEGSAEAARQISGFRPAAQVIGMNIAGSAAVKGNAVGPELKQRIVDAKADAIFIAGAGSSTAKLIEALRLETITLPILSSQPLSGAAIETIKGAGVHFARVTTGPGEQFKRHFESVMGKPSRGYAAYGYDAATVLLNALVKFGEMHPGVAPSRTELALLVRETRGLPGASSAISFDSVGENLTSWIHIFECANGKAELRQQLK